MSEIIAVSYGRTSKEKDDAFSVESQLKANRMYAELHGLTVPDSYNFREDFTGKTLDRPELSKIRELMKAKKIQALIVYATDRLARKVGIADLLLDELFEYGVTLHVVAWGSHLRDTPEDRMRFNFESTYADFERRKIIERTTRGRKEKLDSGIYHGTGHPPFGYSKEGRKRETKLVIIEKDAKIARDIFIWYAVERVTVSEIRKRLRGTASPGDLKGYGKNGGKVRAYGDWAEATIYQILHNPTYKGTMELTAHTLQVPVIIEPSIWEMASERLRDGRTMSPRGQKYQYLMARRLKCRLCGYAVQTTPNWRRGELTALYYRCSSFRPQTARKQCSLPRFRVEKVDELVWSVVREIILNPSTLRVMLEDSQTELAAKHIELQERLDRTEKRLEKERNRLAVLLIEYADNQAGDGEKDEAQEYVANIYRQAKEAAEETVRELMKERDSVSAQIGRVTIPEGLLEDLDEFAATIKDGIDILPFEGRRKLIETMGFRGELAIEDGQKIVYITWYTHSFRRALPELDAIRTG